MDSREKGNMLHIPVDGGNPASPMSRSPRNLNALHALG